MQTQQLRRSTLIISALSILPHMICCAIPAVAALVALGTTVGLGAALANNALYHFIDQYHMAFLGVAVIGVVFSGLANYAAYRMDCDASDYASCSSKKCNPNKAKSFRIFMLSCFLLVLDLAWLATEEFVLDLPHEAAHHAVESHQH